MAPAPERAEAGLDVFMSSMAILSVNLGLMNLLPIPVLDGFALLAAIWEGIRRRPIPTRAREYANMVGLAMLMLAVIVTVRVFRPGNITHHRVQGAICVYLLAGMAWAYSSSMPKIRGKSGTSAR